MAIRKIKNKGFTLVEIMIAVTMMGGLSLASMKLIESKNIHSSNAIVRTRELTDLIKNIRFIKKDVEYAHKVERQGTSLIIKQNKLMSDDSLKERIIKYEMIDDCNLGRSERVKNDRSGNKTQFNTGTDNSGNFSCLQRIIIINGISTKKLNLTGIKSFKWCLTNGDCGLLPATDSIHKIETPLTSFTGSSPSMLKLEILDYKGVILKMILGLSNIGFLNIERKDIIFID